MEPSSAKGRPNYWDDWEKRFQALTAPIRGFYGVSYEEETKMFKEYIAPTDLSVKTLT